MWNRYAEHRPRDFPAVASAILSLIAATMLWVPGSARAGEPLPADPFESVMWPSMASRFFPGEIVFDARVQVQAPASAEDQFQVPVTVDATAIDGVIRLVAVADLNPIPHILTMTPVEAEPWIAFRVKLQQGTVIHVGVLTEQGVWHVGGTYVDAAGGGCTAPAAMHAVNNWMQTLGQSRALWHSGDNDRLALRIRHPMDTGLADGIPAFYLNALTVRDAEQRVLAELELFEPVSENPTLRLRPRVAAGIEALRVDARDTEANEFAFQVTPSP